MLLGNEPLMLQPLLARQPSFPSMLPLPPLLVLLQPMPRTDTAGARRP